jgi:hypothetical protein
MKEIIDRLAALNAEANAVRELIETAIEDGEIHGAPLYNVQGCIKEVVGAIILESHKAGNLKIELTDIPGCDSGDGNE